MATIDQTMPLEGRDVTQEVFTIAGFTKHWLSDKTDSVAQRVLKSVVAFGGFSLLSGFSGIINCTIGEVRLVHAAVAYVFGRGERSDLYQLAQQRFKHGCYQIFAGLADYAIGLNPIPSIVFIAYCANEKVSAYGDEFFKSLVR